jgi:uncharacterized protein YqhQ
MSETLNTQTLPKIDFAVGGQALIEGVMMRSPNFITAAVRKTSGDLTIKKDPFKSIGVRFRFLGVPFVRGVVNLFEMMIIGMKMLNFSATVQLDETPAETINTKTETDTTPKISKTEQIFTTASFVFSIVFALGLSLFLFKFLPLWITDLLSKSSTVIKDNYLVYNLIDGGIKTVFFVTYIGILGLTPSLKRVFQYHGAEHKSIFTYERGLELTPENAAKQTRFHPRCGTSFILVVFMLSIFIYTFVPRHPDFYTNFGIRVLFLPLIAGISYEFLRFSAKNQQNRLVNLLTLPGLMFQRLTTKEPDHSQLEVALTALKAALELEHQRVLQPQTVPNVP